MMEITGFTFFKLTFVLLIAKYPRQFICQFFGHFFCGKIYMKEINDIQGLRKELICKEIDYRNALQIRGDANEAKRLHEEIKATHLRLRTALLLGDKKSPR